MALKLSSRMKASVAKTLGIDVVKEIDESDRTYLHQLVSAYRSLPAMVDNPDARRMAEGIVERVAGDQPIAWTDIDAMEIALLSLIPAPMLKREAWNIRARYRDMVGQAVYDVYLSSDPPGVAGGVVARPGSSPSGRSLSLASPTSDSSSEIAVLLVSRSESATPHVSPPESVVPHAPSPVAAPGAPGTVLEDDAALRADLLALLSEIQWLYVYWPERESIRNTLYLKVFLIAAVVIVLEMVFYYWSVSTQSTHLTTVTLVVLTGVIGGFISTQARLYGLPKGVHMVNLYELRLSPFSVMQAPISGGVFAVLLYLIFLGGLVEGALFPKMDLMGKPTDATLQTAREVVIRAAERANVSQAAETAATAEMAVATNKMANLAMTARTATQRAATSHDPKDRSAADKATNDAADAAKIASAKQQAQQVAAHKAKIEKTAADKAVQARVALEEAAEDPTPFNWENLDKTEPASIPDFGKLLVWAFIAGFAERFVPDTLQRLIGKAQTIDSAKRN